MAKKSKVPELSEQEIVNRHQFRMGMMTWICSLLQTAIIGATVVASFYVAIYLPLLATAGQETTVTYLVKMLGEFNVTTVLGWGVGAAGTVYGISEKRKRVSERAEKDKRIVVLEKAIDPSRTSSGLDPAGNLPGLK